MQKLIEERETLLTLYAGLTVPQIRKAIQHIMRYHKASIDSNIKPLFQTRVIGIAKTIRYLPYAGPKPASGHIAYSDWVEWYTRKVCPAPWLEDIQAGDFCVLDQSGINAGLMGPLNCQTAIEKGARAFLTNGGVYDATEIIRMEIPFWAQYQEQHLPQGKLQYEAQDIPIVIDNVVIHPGDIMIADKEDIIAIPKDIAHDVIDFIRRNPSHPLKA
ncbi:MAG: RraA family protein [Anaerolineae bacterium]|nr:RraA family protein [Anaerolineae bacterium]